MNVRAGSTENVKFHLLRNSLPFDVSGADRITVNRKSAARIVDSFASDDPSPIVTVDPSASHVVILAPAASFWAQGSKHYFFSIQVEIGSAVYKFPSANHTRIEVVDDF